MLTWRRRGRRLSRRRLFLLLSGRDEDEDDDMDFLGSLLERDACVQRSKRTALDGWDSGLLCECGLSLI